MGKKSYRAPELISHGGVQDLTRGGTKANSDVPTGVSGTAYPPKGSS